MAGLVKAAATEGTVTIGKTEHIALVAIGNAVRTVVDGHLDLENTFGIVFGGSAKVILKPLG